MHDHMVVEGHFRKVIEQFKPPVEEDVSCTPRATLLAITLTTNKKFIFKHLLNEDGKGLIEVLKGNNLHQMMDKFIVLSLPNV
jgi:hypothetical protein